MALFGTRWPALALAASLSCLALGGHAQSAAPDPAPASPASSRAGPYLVVALGHSVYDYRCNFYACANSQSGGAGKLGLGYRYGVFAVEGWFAEFGKTDLGFYEGSMQARSVGVSASWVMRFGDWGEGLLRTGLASVRLDHRTNTSSRVESKVEPTFGVGLDVALTPRVSLELAGDMTFSKSSDLGDPMITTGTLGLRVRF